MNKHSYYHMLTVLRKQRNALIAEFRHFKRDPVVRKWLAPSAFSHTVSAFRRKIAEADKLIAGGKLAIQVSRETGETYWYNYHTDSVYSEGIAASEYTAK